MLTLDPIESGLRLRAGPHLGDLVMQDAMIPSFTRYSPTQRERLERLVRQPEWADLLARRAALEQWKADVRTPPPVPGQQAKANEYLRERNAGRVRALLDEGVTGDKTLLEAVGDWEAGLAGDDRFPVVFLGLVVTLDCSFLPRCVYCNQLWVPRQLTLDDWKAVLAEVAEPVPPYVYLTGGEPLILGAEVWGDDGLVASAARLRCAVNINTNAALLAPHVALQLVKVGTAKLHVSIDTHDERAQDALLGAPERWGAVLKGLFNVQLAREVLGADHPQIHVNCVMTSRTLSGFPDLLRFLLEIRPTRSAGFEGNATDDPAFYDYAVHLIPVGGSENALLRPTAAEWKRFYTETWAEAERVWDDHQENLGVPEADRAALSRCFPFTNPYFRVSHEMSLDEYCELAGQGRYWQGALRDRCYVAPTQAFVLPDGSQHWCGAHAIRRPPPLGNVTEAGVRENIRANIGQFSQYPNESCAGCAGATCAINQAAERNLVQQVREWAGEVTSG
jgi:MoaA/NifB/PqqE/SkfB family radical SAM enzyme